MIRYALLAVATTLAFPAAAAAPHPATLTVVYPAAAGTHFDRDYYKAKHLKLVRDTWMPLGMTNITVAYGTSKLGGGDAPYHLIALLTFRSRAALDKAVSGPSSKAVFGDIPKFTDVAPVGLIGD